MKLFFHTLLLTLLLAADANLDATQLTGRLARAIEEQNEKDKDKDNDKKTAAKSAAAPATKSTPAPAAGGSTPLADRLSKRLPGAATKEAKTEVTPPAQPNTRTATSGSSAPVTAGRLNRKVGSTAGMPDPAKVGAKSGTNASKVINVPDAVPVTPKGADAVRTKPRTKDAPLDAKQRTYDGNLIAKDLQPTRQGSTIQVTGVVGTSGLSSIKGEPVEGSWWILRADSNGWNSTPIASGFVNLQPGQEQTVTGAVNEDVYSDVNADATTRFRLHVRTKSTSKELTKECPVPAPTKWVVRFRTPEWTRSDRSEDRNYLKGQEDYLKQAGFETQYIVALPSPYSKALYGEGDTYWELQYRRVQWIEKEFKTEEAARRFQPAKYYTEVIIVPR